MRINAMSGNSWLAIAIPFSSPHHTSLRHLGEFPTSKAELTRKWGHTIARGWATILLDRLRDFVVWSLSLRAENPLLRASLEERAILACVPDLLPFLY